MKRALPITLALLVAGGSTLLAGCAAGRGETASLYDFGPLPAQQSGAQSALPASTPLPPLPPISIAEIQVPAWLDSTHIYYRLNYANSQQPRPYAHARWTMTPAQLLLQHLKARISQAGGVALAASHGAANIPVLRIEADDFTQNFDAPAQSSAQVILRASVFRGRTLIAHKSFVMRAPAPAADAAGGAQALAAASDAAVTDMILWLAKLDLK
ncbi:MAG TPA: ABC-type transport auxiliary lipoprotein family protein [Noviherbaspirillum sp.]|nr:ABC-type transport auxiliary lipoprotein family protein [Noviherbaspirillum sp.]